MTSPQSPAPSSAGASPSAGGTEGAERVIVFVNNEPYDMTEAVRLTKDAPTEEMLALMTADKWKASCIEQLTAKIPWFDPHYTIVLMHDDGRPDQVMRSIDKIHFTNGMRFWLVPPALGA